MMFQIVSATAEDAEPIQQLLRDTWKHTYGDHLSQKTLEEVYKNWQSLEFLTRQIEHPTLYFPLAKNGDELVGIATVNMTEETIMMFRLYVSPQNQRQGIGELLLKNVIEHYQGAKKIQLYVEVMNSKGQSFYKKHGFKEIAHAEEKVVDEVIEVILMEKQL